MTRAHDAWPMLATCDSSGAAVEKMIGSMHGHWRGKPESIPACWDRCDVAGPRRKSLHAGSPFCYGIYLGIISKSVSFRTDRHGRALPSSPLRRFLSA